MESIPRGKALIFVSLEKLLPEADRFASVFGQLYFDVEIHAIKSCVQMMIPLQALAQKEYPDGDEQRTCDIVDIFSESNVDPDDPDSARKCDKSFDRIPKIFVFNCCQDIVTKLSAFVKTKQRLLVFDMSLIDKNWYNKSTRTYICYTCAEATMDKPEVRIRFMQNMDQFLSRVTLSPLFMTLLENHTCAHNLIKALQEITDITAKKVFIFTEFNRDRNACNELVDFLKRSGQYHAARELELYNQWTEPLVYSQDVRLIVKKAHTFRSGASRWFVMDGAPRGRVLLFLQVPDLQNEADRFDDLFQKLFFSVDVYKNYSCDEIVDTLKTVSEGEFKKDALIVMFIGHGRDQMVQGNGASDEIHIKKLVDLFSENKYTGVNPQEPVVDREWMDGTTRTFICYACADGTASFYTGKGYTLYGQAFSHCIAEYAYDLNLTQIFNKTCDEMNRAIMQQRPELIMKNVDRELYFNPGLYKD
ncbi:unnamed protein product [Oppiella nova]|uniref:Caspase family p20 domain-containing protein n=1 Tax=Oppiella nova TaxID=334625 RepID=A0A7R9LHT1_9ACAR|nr:unnamed protein product [Oppiella nova]CAG2163795.1 unnamed protein product [Oppiella nova]